MSKRSSTKRPPEKFIFVIDEDLGSQFSKILSAACGDGSTSRFDVVEVVEQYGSGTLDEVWIPDVARKGQIAITRDGSIRNAHENVVKTYNARLLVVAGKRTHKEYAENFISSFSAIERYLIKTPAPFMARITSPRPEEVKKKRNPKGRIQTFYPRK